ncbi:protein ALP1-like isoform X1 [Salvia splendens]|uniref:protein ALP1-like isoform X1 n=1 Tax=Salvia splendens TaxID=180675 RepID=UPI001C2794FD|nr:protein ALP1-like isoform X1 [Salvia splendens]XP_041992245.1 protein ALP1-like isoform X1 [Salvia splendens]
MDRNAFGRLCRLFRELRVLRDRRFVCIEEQVAIFLGVLAHHKKNRIVRFDFLRSGDTVSRYVHEVMETVLKMHSMFVVKPEPIKEGCVDWRWKHFKGCLGALDGTYINVQVRNEHKPKFRNRKGQITTNTLAACDRYMRFTYVLPGWEGSAGDARILRDAVNRPYGLKVPIGNYYLCDNGYANSEGFLTPYRGVRYHLKEWGPDADKPQNAIELFNMRHTKARNVIERAFAVLKMRWGILRSASYYPIKVQIRLIFCCFLLHNYVRSAMSVDPLDALIDGEPEAGGNEGDNSNIEYVDVVEATSGWNMYRDDLANIMWSEVSK